MLLGVAAGVAHEMGRASAAKHDCHLQVGCCCQICYGVAVIAHLSGVDNRKENIELERCERGAKHRCNLGVKQGGRCLHTIWNIA
jgi:hypothetical protein